MPCTRRSALATLAGASILPLLHPLRSIARATDASTLMQVGNDRASPRAADPFGPLPVTGRALPGLEALDPIVTSIIEQRSVAGAAIAISKGGALKLARGYGFRDLQAGEPMQARTSFLLASVSKVPTAQTVLKLVDEGSVSLSDRIFHDLEALRPPPDRREDPRLNEITVEMCLSHTGGWDRKRTPLAGPEQVRRALRIDRVPTPEDFIRFQKGVPLDFAPGTEQSYSNFGYVLLGAMIAMRNRERYPDIVQAKTLRPMGIDGMRIDPVSPEYLPDETHRYTAPMEHPIPGGHPAMTMAAGGWEANCIDMAKLLTAIDGSRTGTPWLSPAIMQAMVTPAPNIPREAGRPWFGLGWDEVESFPPETAGGPQRYGWAKDGALPGISTWIQHLAIGVDLVILINTSGGEGLGALRPKVLDFIRGVTQWPDGDLFSEFP